MDTSIKKFLEFNGKTIYFLAKGGTYWIAIKPICEALGVEYTRQFKNLKKDKILGAALAKQPMQVGEDQLRQYACLPEFFIYGWLFKIKSDSHELENYQWKCYELLYDYFHGMVTSREKLIKEKTKEELEIESLQTELATLPAFQRIEYLKGRIKLINKGLRDLDNQTKAEQLQLFKS